MKSFQLSFLFPYLFMNGSIYQDTAGIEASKLDFFNLIVILASIEPAMPDRIVKRKLFLILSSLNWLY